MKKLTLLFLLSALIFTGCSKDEAPELKLDKSELFGEWVVTQHKVTFHNTDDTPFRDAYIFEDPKPTHPNYSIIIDADHVTTNNAGAPSLKYTLSVNNGKKYINIDGRGIMKDEVNEYAVKDYTMTWTSEEVNANYAPSAIPKAVTTITFGRIK